MPIEAFADIRVLSQPEFHAIDEKVMGIVRVIHESFVKDYFLDLLFNSGALLEAKTKEALSGSDRNQTLTDLFLAGLHHARLVNMRPERVEYEFVSTRLTQATWREFEFVERGWRELNPESAWLKTKLADLLRDWGAFLDVSLYREAITHFLGGPERVVSKVEVFSGDVCVGHQPTHLLAADTAFAFSAVPERQEQMREHQLRFLRHTRLKAIQWVNFNQHTITFQSLTR